MSLACSEQFHVLLEFYSPVSEPDNLRAEEVGKDEGKGRHGYEASTCLIARNVSEKYQSQIHRPPEHRSRYTMK